MAPADAGMGTYLVERYWLGVGDRALRDALGRLELARAHMAREGRVVQHLGSYLMADDQVVFSFMRATSAALVREANERAALPFERISEVNPYGVD
jgi:hypothetical protein